ncbi:hypothetical protein BP6252_13594 [Coleophoma cylindrospora]|uniref:BZIP domain-containing protein n=1 Tax=Coleophoma cylindrospora TaxID=1849047 RepID=A0A3D8Q8M1_9HELO|nr:hypothetical protein BP6252_13594 [Coleophoma cylindrospora]
MGKTKNQGTKLYRSTNLRAKLRQERLARHYLKCRKAVRAQRQKTSDYIKSLEKRVEELKTPKNLSSMEQAKRQTEGLESEIRLLVLQLSSRSQNIDDFPQNIKDIIARETLEKPVKDEVVMNDVS